MKISYAITVCNEFVEIQRLITFLLKNKRSQDEIVVLVDMTKNEPTSELDWKNYLTSICSGNYIFQIDADEIPHENLINSLPDLLEENQMIDVLRVPRVNTVEGLTEEHIRRWGWNVNEKGWVNWADWQMRIYRNSPEIKWINKVHEVLDGFKYHGMLPLEEEWALYHPKTIEKQEKQNNYYSTL